MRGKFIVIDGIDGVGKGLQSALLADWLKAKGMRVWLTKEPYNPDHVKELRGLLKESTDFKSYARKLTELFVADRRIHVAEIEKRLIQGESVISDRFILSTLAYQSMQGVDLQELIAMHEGMLRPDITIILDAPAEVVQKRVQNDENRAHLEIFERERATLEQLRNNFLSLAKRFSSDPIVIIDGVGTPEEVAVRIQQAVASLVA